VSKGVGLQFVADRIGITPAQTLAFGDGENDLELLEWAGYAVAVENAHPALKKRANLIAPSVEEEGVAQVIEAFLTR
jgi:Predicted hydrolases of the HAD superfamily